MLAGIGRYVRNRRNSIKVYRKARGRTGGQQRLTATEPCGVGVVAGTSKPARGAAVRGWQVVVGDSA